MPNNINTFLYEIPFTRIQKRNFNLPTKQKKFFNLQDVNSPGLYFCYLILKQDFNYVVKEFLFLKFGKPYFMNSNLVISISYTDEFLYIGICKNEKIGIDAEKISNPNLEIANQFMSEKELTFLSNTIDKNKYFYTIWTLKESFLKFTGDGINDSLKKIEFYKNSKGKYTINSISDDKIFFNTFNSKGCIISTTTQVEAINKIVSFSSSEEFLQKYEN